MHSGGGAWDETVGVFAAFGGGGLEAGRNRLSACGSLRNCAIRRCLACNLRDSDLFACAWQQVFAMIYQ